MKIMLIEFYTLEQAAMMKAIRLYFKLKPGQPIPDGKYASDADVEAVRQIYEGLIAEPSGVQH